MEFSIRDTLRLAIETASGGENTIMYDNQGNPNVMVRLAKYNASLIDSKFTGVHPAFVLDDDITVGEIWVSKYKNTLGSGNVPVSIQGTIPARVSFADAKALCKKKGRGWHLMTNLEYMALTSVPLFQQVKQHTVSEFSANAVRATTIKDGGGNERVGGRTSASNIGMSVNGVSDIGCIGPEFADGLYVGNGKHTCFYYHGNGKQTQNRILDDKYMSSNFTADAPETDAVNIYIDTDDAGYLNTSRYEKRESPLYNPIVTFSNVSITTLPAEKVVIPQDLILHGVCASRITPSSSMISVYATNNTSVKRVATRGYSKTHNLSQPATATDIQDIDFVSLATDTDSKYFNYFRAVYIDY